MKTRIVLFTIALILASLACSAATPSDTSTDPAPVQEEEPAAPTEPTPLPSPTPDSGILFEDDFSDTSSGWDRIDDEDGITDYYDGGYRILVNQDNRFFFANPGLTDLPNDVRIEVEATKLGGSDDNNFGIICRYQDTSNFYRIIVSSDGFAGIILVQDGTSTNLTGEGLVPFDSALAGNATNEIRVNCIGSTLTLFVNGEQVLTTQDSTFSNGDVGLFAGAFDIVGTDILFDNFIVTRP